MEETVGLTILLMGNIRQRHVESSFFPANYLDEKAEMESDLHLPHSTLPRTFKNFNKLKVSKKKLSQHYLELSK